MKVALVGIGKIALDQHVPAIRNAPEWELAATVSRNATVDGAAGFSDLDQMLAQRPDIGVVSLCLPPVPRYRYAAMAIAAGRHVMLEKPPGATLTECRTLEAMAREKGVALYATWHSRQAGKVAAAKAWLAGKSLRRLHITWRENVRQWHPGQDWVFEPGGLGVFDPGINALSILTEILVDPIHLAQAELHFPQNRQTPIAAIGRFHHGGGAEVSFEFDWLADGAPCWRIEAETDAGTLILDEGGSVMRVDGEADTSAETITGEYPRLYARMAELVRQGVIDMDLAPMRHVADAFTLGRRINVAPFAW